MSQKNNMQTTFEDIKKNITNVVVFVAILWLIKVLDTLVFYDFFKLGILPRNFTGLRGIVFAPLLHGSYVHIISNTLPIAVLLSFYKKEAFKVILGSVIIGGTLVWIFARKSYHVGISGLIYSLATFLITAGIFKRNTLSILISLGIIVLYGGLIWGVFPQRMWISWESHLFGAIAGIIMAYVLFKKKK